MVMVLSGLNVIGWLLNVPVINLLSVGMREIVSVVFGRVVIFW